MIAQTFLQYASRMDYYKTITKRNGGVIPCHQNLCELYTQPFDKSDLDSDSGLFNDTRSLTKFIYAIGPHKHVEIDAYETTYSPMSKIKIPFGTIDQFIGDCQRFGIELYWKKWVVDKYFL